MPFSVKPGAFQTEVAGGEDSAVPILAVLSVQSSAVFWYGCASLPSRGDCYYLDGCGASLTCGDGRGEHVLLRRCPMAFYAVKQTSGEWIGPGIESGCQEWRDSTSLASAARGNIGRLTTCWVCENVA